MPVPRLAATASGQEVAEALGREGCAVVERLVPPALLDQARAELGPHLDATPVGTDDFMGHRTRRTGGLVARSATCREVVMHPLVLDAVRGVLGHATSFQLHLTQVIAIGPGAPAQKIHRDQWAFDFCCSTPVRCITARARIAARALATGSTSPAVSWLRQEENQYLSVPAEIARTLPEPLLRLMGYARGAYSLGYVDDLRDPLDALFGSRGSGVAPGDLAAAEKRARAASTRAT